MGVGRVVEVHVDIYFFGGGGATVSRVLVFTVSKNMVFSIFMREGRINSWVSVVNDSFESVKNHMSGRLLVKVGMFSLEMLAGRLMIDIEEFVKDGGICCLVSKVKFVCGCESALMSVFVDV